MPKLGAKFVLTYLTLIFDSTVNFCMDINFVNGKYINDTMTGTRWKRCDGQTDRQTGGQTGVRTGEHANGIGLAQIFSFMSVWSATHIFVGWNPSVHLAIRPSEMCEVQLREATLSCPSVCPLKNVTLWVATPSCLSACPSKMVLGGMQPLLIHLSVCLYVVQLSHLRRMD